MKNEAETKHSCTQCGSIYSKEAHLKLHIKRKHVKEEGEISHDGMPDDDDQKIKIEFESQLQCDECDSYVCMSKAALAAHKEAMHQDVTHYCPLCKYKSKIRRNLLRHKSNAHDNVKIFHCNQCDKTSSSKTGLKLHIDCYHKGVRYSCDKCYYFIVTRIFVAE